MSRRRGIRGKLLGAGWLVLLFLAGAVESHAQECDSHARAIAQETVRSWMETWTETDRFFFVTRREDLEIEFWNNVPTVQEGFGKDFFVFEISTEGDELLEKSVMHHISVHGTRPHIVAVAPASVRFFRLSGFKDSHREFNRLGKVYGARPRGERSLLEYAQFYRHLAPAHMGDPIVRSLLELKQMAERKFDYGSGGDFATGQKHFDKWWAKNSEALARISLEETVTETPGGSVVAWYTLSDISWKGKVRGPALLKVTLEVSKEGYVQEPRISLVDLE